VAAEGRYLVIVADPGQPESVLHDETITFVSLFPPLTQADLDQRAAADRDPFSPPSTGE
jgi:hypothetical protein